MLRRVRNSAHVAIRMRSVILFERWCVFHHVSPFTENKRSLVVDYNVLANEQQVIAFFLPEAPTEMLKIFHEVNFLFC